MKIKLIASVVGTLIAASAYAQAETYSIEAGAQIGTFSADDETKQSLSGIAGTYYFKPIAIDSTQPFAEMEFLQKASGLSVRYGNLKYEDSIFTSTTVNPLEISGKFYVGDFVLGLSNSTWNKNFNLKSNNARYYGIKTTTTEFNVGYFVLPNTLVSYVNEKESAAYSPSTGLSAVKDLNATTNGVKSHTVMPLGGTQSLVLDFEYSQIKREQTSSDSNSEFGANIRYYPEAKLFFEGGYKTNTGDRKSNTGNTISAGFGYAFTPRFGVLLTTSKFSGDVASEKSSNTSTMLTAGYRF